jgi:putative CocE/NonD family hydrolase
MVIAGIGVGLAMAPTTTTAIGSVPVDKADIGSGVVNTFRQTGGALGIAIMGAILASNLGGATPGTREFAQNFVPGFQDALLLAAFISLAGSVVGMLTISKVRTEEVYGRRLGPASAPAAARIDAVGPPTLVVDRDVAVPMRDGVVLRADVYRPATDNPVPAVVNRTPYDRTRALVPQAALDPDRAAQAGFALVCQDVRGQYGSDGEFATFLTEGQDSYDTVEWTAAQPWCTGAVGMAGRSYAGAAQWLGAAERPPHLRALFPVVTGSDYYEGWIYQGGAFQLGFNLFWTWLMTDQKAARLDELYRHLPLTTAPLPTDTGPARSYRTWLEHPTDDWYWQALSINRRYDRVEVPAFNVGGWYDIFLRGTLENFTRMRREGGSEAARAGQRLLIGPWAHGSTYGSYPDHSFKVFGTDDAADLDELQLRWFDRHLRGGTIDDESPVRIFVMGENRWRDEPDWPPPGVRPSPYFLCADGVLSPDGPGPEPPDEYVYDPAEPSPTVGGPTSLPALFLRTNSGPLDQRKVEARPDVLVYTSAPLERPLEATGPLTVVLHAATDAPDTDFVAKLSDVDSDGVSRILAEGIVRARFREGYGRERPLEPGTVYEYAIDLVATSNVFEAGHRIRLAITSSSFPRFDRNPNTGNPLGADRSEDLRPARQTIFHDAGRPSHVVLPVLAR